MAFSIKVNGSQHNVDVDGDTPLLWVLRDSLGLTGTKYGCDAGICGACTIFINGEAARSCITLAVQADGAELMTVEGLADGDRLHPLQQAFHEHHGLQCGFCTPGMLMIALDLLNTVPDPTEAQVREGMSAAICRCTGYQGIVEAVMAVSKARKQAEGGGGGAA